MIKYFIDKHEIFNEKEYPTYIGLINKIIMHCPQYNCTKKSSKELWDKLPKNKSLFYCDEYHGIPIGNLTSQIFANFFLHIFDKRMLKTFEYYGRYVDDFVIVHESKEFLLEKRRVIQKYLKDRLDVTLHPNKTYIQHYSKGVKFIGGVLKPNRMYIANRTKGNLYGMIYKYYNIVTNQHRELTHDEIMNLYGSINSYFGFMKHYKTYKIRYKFLNSEYFKPFLKYFYTNTSLSKVILHEAYKKGTPYLEKSFAKEKERNMVLFKDNKLKSKQKANKYKIRNQPKRQ